MAANHHWSALHAEIASEEALAQAASKKLPIVITVPTEVSRAFGKLRLKVAGDAPCFESYLSELIRKTPNMYLLPTLPSSGALIGYTEQRKAALLSTYGLLEYSDTAIGRRFYDPLCRPRVIEVLCAGGYLDGCLTNTVTPLLGQVEVSIVEHLAISQRHRRIQDGEVEYSLRQIDIPEGEHPRIRALSRLLDTTPTRDARRELLRIFIEKAGVANNYTPLTHAEHHAIRHRLRESMAHIPDTYVRKKVLDLAAHSLPLIHFTPAIDLEFCPPGGILSAFSKEP